MGSYEVLAAVGAGGMGEVYRARDTKLGRDVALKIIPDIYARDPDRMARFRREARLLASLNHPNIAAIYGVEESDGRPALVLEYIEGQTLAERIARGPIELDVALNIAVQIAEAIEAAHEKPVIHRDLKPANVKITPQGVVKVLDFGLARTLDDEGAPSQDLSESPTMSAAATGAGIMLGTAGYMAPEQVRGRSVDRRADVWAFGVVLFEMLSGRRCFDGETATDSLAKILEREPDWNKLPPRLPVALRNLIQRCLAKNPKDRIQAIGDARLMIQDVIANPIAPTDVATPSYPLWKKLLPWAVALLSLAVGQLWRQSPSSPDGALSVFDVPLPPGQSLTHNYRHGLDLSMDGRRIAFIANPIGSPPRRIYVRTLNQPEVVALAGTEGAQNPFFSPDGQWVGFLIGHQIRKAALAGGVPAVVADDVGTSLGVDWGPLGITWGTNGDIVFPMGLGTGLSVVRETGGERKVFTDLDPKNNEVSHRLPHFLPDGSGVLFTVLRYSNITPDWKRSQVWLKSLKTGERKLLIENALDARFTGRDSLIFAREGKLYAIRFDPRAQAVSGSPVLVLDGVVQTMYGTAGVQWTGAAQYSVSDTGALFYAPGSVEPPDLSTIVSVNRQGVATPVQGLKRRSQLYVRVAPDGKRIAFSELYVEKDIWVFDTIRGTEDRQTYEGQNAAPLWSPDGSFLAFRSDRTGPLGLYLTKGLNTREVTPLTSGPNDTPSSWTPDGKQLIFTRGAGSLATIGSGTDLYIVSIDHPNEVKPIVATDADERFPELSPDGKWLAYCSNETGAFQIYVQPFPGSGKRVTLTSDGGQEPAWSRDGSNQLFYINRGKMMSIHYTVAGSEFVPEMSVPLFDVPFRGAGATIRIAYDVAPDGRFFGVVSAPDPADDRLKQIAPSTLRFILNWTTEVDRLLGK